MSETESSVLRPPRGYTVLLVREPICISDLMDALIGDALGRHYGSIAAAARALGISKRTIQRALRRRPELAGNATGRP